MNRLYVLLFGAALGGLFTAVNPAFAQSWTLTSAPTNLTWSCVAASADGSKLAAVAYYPGGIYTSTNTGSTWTQTSAPTNSYWYSVASSADGSKLVAAGGVAGIYTSANSGSTWTLTSASTNNTWYSVASSADGSKLVAVVEAGGIYTSADSGSTWTLTSAPTDSYWDSVASSADGTKLAAIIGGDDEVYTSADSGATWTLALRTQPNFSDGSSVASSADGTELVVAIDGEVIISTNSGGTWTGPSKPLGGNWSSVASSTDGARLVVVANGGSIYTTADSGRTWAQTSAPNENWRSVASSADGTKLAAVFNVVGGRVQGSGIYTLDLTIPQIIGQPGSETVLAGTNVALSAGVSCLAPLTYQWQFNGTNLPGATNAVLALAYFTPSNAGSYALLVTNDFGAALSSNAVLAVVPVIIVTEPQPPSQTVLAGTNVTLTMSALSIAPPTYQWEFNGANLPGATNATLTLTNVVPLNSGAYSVLISNSFGSLWSSSAMVIVLPAFVTTLPATGVSATGVTLNGAVVTGESESVVWFEWGVDTNYGSLVDATIVPAGDSLVAVSSALSGLSTNVYHYRLVAWNSQGLAYGADQEFAVRATVWNTNDGGGGSLRQAILDAMPGDTLNLAVVGAITLTNGALVITNNLTIIGPGATNLALSGNTNSRVFEIASSATVSISGLTIRDGYAGAWSPGYQWDGGGIYNAGALAVTACVIVSNSAGNAYANGNGLQGGCGGGIYNAGTLVLDACTLVGNTAGTGGSGYQLGGTGGQGGAICNAGTLTLSACALATNSAGLGGLGVGDGESSFGGMGGSGGAIYNTNTLSLNSTTFSGNSAGNGGAAQPASLRHGGPGGNGGAVCSMSTLAAAATNCAFIANRAGAASAQGGFYAVNGGDGGGFYGTGPLVLVGCRFNGNQGGQGGPGFYGLYPPTFGGTGGVGGVYAATNLVMLECIVQANVGGSGSGASVGPGSGSGGAGGVFNGGTSTMTACSFDGNIGGSGGQGVFGGVGGQGGVFNSGQLTFISCTLNGNSGGIGGAGNLGGGNGGNGGAGGISSSNSTANALTLIACTVSGNTGGAGGVGGAGYTGYVGGNGGNGGNGAILNSSPGLSAQLLNTLVALNDVGAAGAGGVGATNGSPGSAGVGPDLAGPFTSLGYNLIGQTDGSTGFANGVNADLAGTTANPLDPALGPLANNGGPTATMALLHGSPALDAGDDGLLGPPYNLTTDQRGFPRKAGAHVDIGAFEFQPFATPPVLLALTRSAAGGFQFAFTDTSGATFSVLSATNLSLASSNWTVLGQALEVAPGQFQFTDPQTTKDPKRFYRVSSP